MYVCAYMCKCVSLCVYACIHNNNKISFIFKKENSTNLYGHSFVALLVFLLFYLPESVWAYSFVPLGI